MENVIELIIDENNEISGIEAISIVENPAIEEDFIALKEHKEVRLAEVDKEKRILMGPALIPNKKIFRKGASDDEDYYIYFSEDTVRKASELFFIKSKQNNSTYEHQIDLNGMSFYPASHNGRLLCAASYNTKAGTIAMMIPLSTTPHTCLIVVR